MENIEKKFEITMFAFAFWISLLSIIFPVVLIMLLSWLWALSIWLVTVIFFTMFLIILSKLFEKPIFILVPLLQIPIAIYFINYVVISMIGRGDKTEFQGYVKPYNLNWEIFNIFYFLKDKKLYQFDTANISSFAHHKIIYHKPITGEEYNPSTYGNKNTVIEIRNEEDFALIILETEGTQG